MAHCAVYDHLWGSQVADVSLLSTTMPEDWTAEALAKLRERFAAWQIWAVRLATQRQTAWCARSHGTPIATLTAWSAEDLAAGIVEAEAER